MELADIFKIPANNPQFLNELMKKMIELANERNEALAKGRRYPAEKAQVQIDEIFWYYVNDSMQKFGTIEPIKIFLKEKLGTYKDIYQQIDLKIAAEAKK